jgi:MOSC domain-containing protein YiiM
VLTCDQCGFDGSEWSASDLERTLANADGLVGHVVAGWSGAPTAAIVPEATATDDDRVDAVHAVMHLLDQLANRRRLDEPFEPMTGTVSSLQASGGGVPKRSVAVAAIGRTGLVGDVQGNRRHHGRPWQAICLYSRDALDALVAEGHPIVAGGVGENLTVAGIDWSRMRGGLTIAIGDVRLRTTSPAVPCHKIAANFHDGDWNRIDHRSRPGWARWYASVLRGGTIRPGDTLTVTS